MKNSKKISKLLISSCLLGHKVRYDGKDNLQTKPRLSALVKEGHVITICPEMAGGLPTPRPPAEIQHNKTTEDVLAENGGVLTINGDDVSTEYIEGAKKNLALEKAHRVQVAILKARSPSCGSQQIYDGTYSGKLINGMGITALLLLKNGIKIFDETQIDLAIDQYERDLQFKT